MLTAAPVLADSHSSSASGQQQEARAGAAGRGRQAGARPAAILLVDLASISQSAVHSCF
jgi:hypothetical protein